jgi:hypothetical protein
MMGGGMMGGGMMGGYGSGLTSAKTITEEEARKAIDAYLTGINDADLELEQARHIYATLGQTRSASEVEGILQLTHQIRERGTQYE